MSWNKSSFKKRLPRMEEILCNLYQLKLILQFMILTKYRTMYTLCVLTVTNIIALIKTKFPDLLGGSNTSNLEHFSCSKFVRE